MTNRKNIIGAEYYDCLMSNPRLYSQTVLSEIFDSSEAIMSDDSREFSAVILSAGAIATEAPASSGVFTNNIEIVDLGDGIRRIAARFRIIRDGLSNIEGPTLTDAIPNPFKAGLTEGQRQRLISQHPKAYTLYPEFEQSPITFGTTVSIRLENDTYFIVKNTTSPYGPSGASAGAIGGPLSAFSLGGSPVTAANQIPGAKYVTAGMNFTSGYKHPTRQGHAGVDIGGKIGDPIHAALGGKVTRVSGVDDRGMPLNPTGHMDGGEKDACKASGGSGCKGFGVVVHIDHGMVKDLGGTEHRLKTIYGHCSQTFVKVGQEVDAGQHIAAVGNEGGSYGAHLHFEVWFNGYKAGQSANPVAVFGWGGEAKCERQWKMPCGWAGWQDDGADKIAIYNKAAREGTGLE